MSTAISDEKFWREVTALVGDVYRPHDPATGVFLFRQKLRRRGFDEARAGRLTPALLARAVPWALFVRLAGREYLRVATYGWPIQCFTCLDTQFEMYLVSWVPGTEGTAEETFLAARISTERLAAIEAGHVTPHDAFRMAEDGFVLRARPDVPPAEVVPCGDLRDEELPPRSQPLAAAQVR